MPIHDASYRGWQGDRVGRWSRFWTITVTGVRRSLRSPWLKRLMLAAFLPLLYFAIPFFLFEQSLRDPDHWRMLGVFLRAMPETSGLSQQISQLPAVPSDEEVETLRYDAWSYLLLTMLRYPQSFLMVLVVGIVAPPLISQDLRTRAYLIYFSRPLTRTEYIVGKFGVVAFFLLIISALPALILYVVGILLSPSVGVLHSTWDLPLRVLVGSAVLVVPTTLVALAISSLTLESRYAGFAWFAVWIIGHVTYSALTVIPSIEAQRLQQLYDPGWRQLASPYHVLGNAQSAIFELSQNGSATMPAFLYLAVVSGVALAILYRRVQAPMRA